MSTDTKAKFPEMSEVLVRGFRGEPSRLKACKCGDGRVEVAGKNPERRLGMPERDVFRFDGEIFERLQSAYRGRDESGLTELWGKAKPFNPESKG
jgi:hypothetical protein